MNNLNPNVNGMYNFMLLQKKKKIIAHHILIVTKFEPE